MIFALHLIQPIHDIVVDQAAVHVLNDNDRVRKLGLEERVMRRAGCRDRRRGAAHITLEFPSVVFFDEGMHFAHPAIDRNCCSGVFVCPVEPTGARHKGLLP